MASHSVRPLSQGVSFTLCMLSYLFAGTAATLMSSYLPVALAELLGPTQQESAIGQIGSYISAAFLYGWMTGGFLFGIGSDRLGRARLLGAATALYGMATLLTVFTSSWEMLILYRFLTGMGIGGVLLLSTVYLSEVWPAKTRPIAMGILAVAFPIGIVTTGGLNVWFTNWRQAFWLGLIPLAVALLIFLLLPESRDWQETKRVSSRRNQSLSDPRIRVNLWTGILVFGFVLVGLWGLFSWLPTWVQTILPPGSTGQRERGFTMILLGFGGIIGGAFSGFLIKLIGTRATLLLTFVGCFLTCCLLFLTNRQFSPIIYLEMGLLCVFFGISQGTLAEFIPQLFPVSVRATATGICFNVGRFFTGTSVLFVGSLVTILGGFGPALLVFSLAFLAAFIILLLNQRKLVHTDQMTEDPSPIIEIIPIKDSTIHT